MSESLAPDTVIAFQQENPKKAGSKAHERYEKYKNAKTVDEALRLGAVKGDIPNDHKKGHLSVVKAGSQAAAPQPKPVAQVAKKSSPKKRAAEASAGISDAPPAKRPNLKMDQLVKNPDSCPRFESNQFMKEKCKNCCRKWQEHLGVITEAQVESFMAAKKRLAEIKANKEVRAAAELPQPAQQPMPPAHDMKPEQLAQPQPDHPAPPQLPQLGLPSLGSPSAQAQPAQPPQPVQPAAPQMFKFGPQLDLPSFLSSPFAQAQPARPPQLIQPAQLPQLVQPAQAQPAQAQPAQLVQPAQAQPAQAQPAQLVPPDEAPAAQPLQLIQPAQPLASECAMPAAPVQPPSSESAVPASPVQPPASESAVPAAPVQPPASENAVPAAPVQPLASESAVPAAPVQPEQPVTEKSSQEPVTTEPDCQGTATASSAPADVTQVPVATPKAEPYEVDLSFAKLDGKPLKFVKRVMGEAKRLLSDRGLRENHREGLDFSLKDRDNLAKYAVTVRDLNKDGKLFKDLERLGLDDGIDLEISIPDGYPLSPPFVRVVYPQLTGGFVFQHGGICFEPLTEKGWAASMTLAALCISIKGILDHGDVRVSGVGNKELRTVPGYTEEGARKDAAYISEAHKGGDSRTYQNLKSLKS